MPRATDNKLTALGKSMQSMNFKFNEHLLVHEVEKKCLLLCETKQSCLASLQAHLL
jgi:hypothetical protein